MKAVPYLRVSTDDKGQDPGRQLMTIKPWATQHNVELLTPIVDEGTSASKTDPFKREKFLEAIQAAKLNGANAILVENIDRFTRRGAKLNGYYKVHLEVQFKLKLWCADRSIENQDSGQGELIESVQAYIGREKSETLSRRVREGMARAKAKGKHMGQPPKKLSALERDLAARLHEDGLGWDSIAMKINELRGAHNIATPDIRKKKSVSGATVRRAFHARTDLPNRAEGPNLSEGSSLAGAT